MNHPTFWYLHGLIFTILLGLCWLWPEELGLLLLARGYFLLCAICFGFWFSVRLYTQKKLVALPLSIVVIKYPFLIVFVWWTVRSYGDRGNFLLGYFVGGIAGFLFVSALLSLLLERPRKPN